MCKKHQVAATAVIAIMSAGAQAQDGITLYGVADIGIEYDNHAGPRANGGDHRLRLVSGGMGASRIGLRGAEDIGGGLKAVFRLESGIRLDTGALAGEAGQLFGREATLGLQGKSGQILAGRAVSTTYDFMLPFDPMGYSSSYSWLLSSSATGGRRDGMLAGVSNLVKARVGTSGFKLGAMFAPGEVAGHQAAGARYGVGVGYDGQALSLAATRDRSNGLASERTETTHLAASWQVAAPLKLSVGYRHYRRAQAGGAADLRSDLYWGGASYRMTTAVTLSGALYCQKIHNVPRDAAPVMLALRWKYALSQRTDLFASTAYARAARQQLVGLSREEAGMASRQFGITMGVQHRF